jgi:hypothetical protein
MRTFCRPSGRDVPGLSFAPVGSESRWRGNDGAHGADAVPREEAVEAVAFAEAMLNYLHVFRARYDEFRARRDKVKRKVKSS